MSYVHPGCVLFPKQLVVKRCQNSLLYVMSDSGTPVTLHSVSANKQLHRCENNHCNLISTNIKAGFLY